MDTTATARRRGTQDGSAGDQLYKTIVIGVLVMQCVLLGFARNAQIRVIEQCLERVIRLVSLLVSVSDFNPVVISNTAEAVDMPRNIAVAAFASVRHPLQ